MTVLVAVLSVEAIPIGVLVGAAFDRSLHRRSRFWLRFAGIVIVVVLPELAAVVAPVGEQMVAVLIWVGLAWGILLLVPFWFVLFRGWGFDPGSANDDDDGPPGPEDGRPTPPSPIGGIPLRDAEPSSARVRDHRPPRRATHPRRPVRERERSPFTSLVATAVAAAVAGSQLSAVPTRGVCTSRGSVASRVSPEARVKRCFRE